MLFYWHLLERKMHRSYKGKKNPFFGKHHTKYRCKKWSKDRKELYKNGHINPMKGKRHIHPKKCKCAFCKDKKGKNHPNYGKNFHGKNNPRYIDGRSLKIYYCKLCGKEISSYQYKLCRPCAVKEQFKCPEKNPFYGKHLTKKHKQKMMLGRGLKPNKPEKWLITILPKRFKYVGNGIFWITSKYNSFNPDFINKSNKKIIEFFGDYWHNLKDHKKRDKLRLQLYKRKGYRTLIIWEHELKNLTKVKERITNFINS